MSMKLDEFCSYHQKFFSIFIYYRLVKILPILLYNACDVIISRRKIRCVVFILSIMYANNELCTQLHDKVVNQTVTSNGFLMQQMCFIVKYILIKDLRSLKLHMRIAKNYFFYTDFCAMCLHLFVVPEKRVTLSELPATPT